MRKPKELDEGSKMQHKNFWKGQNDFGQNRTKSCIAPRINYLRQNKMRTFNEWIEDNTLPSFFRSTQYRLPTEEELNEFKDYPDLDANLIFDKFGYAIIGRGMNSEANKQKIRDSIEMLVAKYPDNLIYQEALEKAK